MFSKACEYLILAVLRLAHASQEDLQMRLNDIAEAIDSPTAFTAKTQ